LEDRLSIKVSVIIPTYKREPEVWMKAVESVFAQTFRELEIILVDDNAPESKHRTANREYINSQKIDERLRYIENSRNMGGALSRNEGIKAAKGDYIAFLDDDDQYLPDKTEKQLAFMQKHDYDMTFSQMMIYRNGRANDIRDYRDIKAFDNKTLLRYHIHRQITGTPTFIYKTGFIREIGGFDDAIMGQEFYLMLKTIEAGAKIGFLDQVTIIVNRSEDSISFSEKKLIGEKRLYLTRKRYFNILTFSERSYARFRHYVIYAVACYRIKKYAMVLPYLAVAFLCSPAASFREAAEIFRKRKLIKTRKGERNERHIK
jgi:glycosyltransferase involved in cell wall biosynthesis